MIEYFADTDTLQIEFRPATIAETRDLGENMLSELGASGGVCAMTIDHAQERVDIPCFSSEQIAA